MCRLNFLFCFLFFELLFVLCLLLPVCLSCVTCRHPCIDLISFTVLPFHQRVFKQECLVPTWKHLYVCPAKQEAFSTPSIFALRSLPGSSSFWGCELGSFFS